MAASSDIIPPEYSASGYEHQQRPHGQRYAFTPEELRVIKECNRESFYYRSLPFASAAMVAVHYGVKAGYLAANPRFGAALKVAGAGFVGWLIGKFSYQSRCEDKLMQLPGSVIGDALRRKRGLPASQLAPSKYDDFGYSLLQVKNSRRTVSVESLVPCTPPMPRRHYEAERQSLGTLRTNLVTRNQLTGDPQDNQVLDFTLKDPQYSSKIADSTSRRSSLDTLGHTTYQGLDDSFRPSMDNPNVTQAPEDLPPLQHKTSYDELRRQNRLEHERRLAMAASSQHQAPQSHSDVSDPVPQQPTRAPPQGAWERQPRSSFDNKTATTTIPGTVPARSTGAKKNDYGDTWDD
ncbi:unnamed protein product [Ixodes hexagonus]